MCCYVVSMLSQVVARVFQGGCQSIPGGCEVIDRVLLCGCYGIIGSC